MLRYYHSDTLIQVLRPFAETKKIKWFKRALILWCAAIILHCGFPFVIPFYKKIFFWYKKRETTTRILSHRPSLLPLPFTLLAPTTTTTTTTSTMTLMPANLDPYLIVFSIVFSESDKVTFRVKKMKEKRRETNLLV